MYVRTRCWAPRWLARGVGLPARAAVYVILSAAVCDVCRLVGFRLSPLVVSRGSACRGLVRCAVAGSAGRGCCVALVDCSSCSAVRYRCTLLALVCVYCVLYIYYIVHSRCKGFSARFFIRFVLAWHQRAPGRHVTRHSPTRRANYSSKIQSPATHTRLAPHTLHVISL